MNFNTVPRSATATLHLFENDEYSVENEVVHTEKLNAREFLDQRAGRKYTSIVTVLNASRVPALDVHAKRIDAPPVAILAALGALRKALEPKENTELFAVLVTKEIENQRQIDTIAFTTEPLENHPRSVAVQVGGAPRNSPQRKCTSWSTERRYLEAGRRPDCAETILATDDGTMYEGLVTNMFVVMSDGSVMTAPDHVVLNGAMRKAVIRVCQDRGITVLQQCPMMKECNKFRAAFLTNVARILQPVHTFWWEGEHVSVSCGQKWDRFVDDLRETVWKRVVDEAVAIPAVRSKEVLNSI